jgi:hypothetical protein
VLCGPWFILKHWLLRQALVVLMTALVVNSWFKWDIAPRSGKTYVPKSKRPIITRTMYTSLNFLQAWVKERATEAEMLVYQWCKTKRRPLTRTKKRSSGSRSYHKPRLKHLLMAYTCSANTATETKRSNHVHFDTDSKILRIDNCATRSISPCISDFVNPPSERDKRIVE